MKASFSRILAINLFILLGVAVALRIYDKASFDDASSNGIEGFAFTMGFAFAIFAQFFANGLLGLIARSETVKQSFWTAALVTLLIGFGACVGGSLSY